MNDPCILDRLDRMKLVLDRTIPIILPSGKDIPAEYTLKSVYCTPTLTRCKSKANLASESAFLLPLMTGYPTKSNVYIDNRYKKIHFLITIPIKDVLASYEIESAKNLTFGCNRLYHLFQDFNDCPNFGREY